MPSATRSSRPRRATAWLAALGAAAALLAGCAGPTVPDRLGLLDPGDVRVQAANGRILSPERSKEILARIGGPEAGDVLGRHLAIEQVVADTPLTLGNRATLLEDGPATYRAMVAAIASARDHVHMETYIFDDDEVGNRFAALLMEKARAGVSVALIRDSVGTLSVDRAFFQRLRDAGVKVVEFNPVNPLRARAGWEVNERDHRKILVVDGRVAILGGINISGVYSSSASGGSGGSGGSAGIGSGGGGGASETPWRDTDVQLEGPVVAELQRMFLAAWADQKGPPLPERNWYPPTERVGSSVVRAIGSTPDEPYSQIYVTLLSAIHAAEREIWIANAYFVPDPQLLGALVGAAARGVDVRVIVPSRTDSSLVFHAGRAKYAELLEGGVKLYERQAALLHAKTAVIDGVWSTVGSTNLDWRSFLHNHEVTAVVLGTEFGTTMRESYERDLAASTPITRESWRQRPVSARLKESFARIWEYWL
jgi:cardiolipin synthase